MRFALYPILTFSVLTSLSGFGQAGGLLRLPASMQQLSVKKPFLRQIPDPSNAYALSTIRRVPASQWRPVNSANFGSRSSPGWVMFQVQSPIDRTVWLELESHFIDSVRVWLIREPGLPTETIKTYQPTGFRTLVHDRDAPTQHPYFLKSLHLLPNVRYAVYIRGWVPPGDVLKFDVSLWHPAAFWQYQQRTVAGWAFFVGLVLMSVFITLVSYAFHPRGIYLYYCGYVLCMSIYALLNEGWGLFLPDPLRWFDSTSRIVHWLSAGILFLMLFTRVFLSVNTKTGWWLLRLNPIWLALLALVINLVIDYGIHHNQFEWVRMGFQARMWILALYAALWLSYVADAIRRRFRPVWLYIVSVLVWLFFYITEVFVVNNGWLTESFPDMLVFRVAVLTEIGLIFIGWMYRQRIIRESQQQLQEQQLTQERALLDTERQRQAEELRALRLQNELQQQRERLARDLHDGIGSQLTHIAGRLDIMSIRHPNEQLQLQRLSLFTRETNQALRDTVWILNRSDIQCSTFAQRLHSYLLRLWEDIDTPRLDWHTNSLATDLSSSNSESIDPILSPLLVQALFRITQEAVNNALKYANATTIHVGLTCADGEQHLTITDDGNGFDPTTATAGYGLTNMQKRAEEAGGTWTLTSTSSGTRIRVSVALTD